MTVNVLVVDNDPGMRQLLEMAVSRDGCQACSCESSVDAVEILKQGEIDFLLLDLNLGSGDSGELLALEWAAAGILPPFLMVTGTPDDARLASLVDLELARGVIAKPFNVLEIAARVVAEHQDWKAHCNESST